MLCFKNFNAQCDLLINKIQCFELLNDDDSFEPFKQCHRSFYIIYTYYVYSSEIAKGNETKT